MPSGFVSKTMRRIALLVVLATALLASSCVQKGYEDGREKQTQKADKMMQDAAE